MSVVRRKHPRKARSSSQHGSPSVMFSGLLLSGMSSGVVQQVSCSLRTQRRAPSRGDARYGTSYVLFLFMLYHYMSCHHHVIACLVNLERHPGPSMFWGSLIHEILVYRDSTRGSYSPTLVWSVFLTAQPKQRLMQNEGTTDRRRHKNRHGLKLCPTTHRSKYDKVRPSHPIKLSRFDPFLEYQKDCYPVSG